MPPAGYTAVTLRETDLDALKEIMEASDKIDSVPQLVRRMIIGTDDSQGLLNDETRQRIEETL